VKLSHIDDRGRARMVDVSAKPESVRTATAAGSIRMSPEAFTLVEGNSGPKGDVLATAELAGSMGAKQTAGLIPMCHPIGLDHVECRAWLDTELPGLDTGLFIPGYKLFRRGAEWLRTGSESFCAGSE